MSIEVPAYVLEHPVCVVLMSSCPRYPHPNQPWRSSSIQLYPLRAWRSLQAVWRSPTRRTTAIPDLCQPVNRGPKVVSQDPFSTGGIRLASPLPPPPHPQSRPTTKPHTRTTQRNSPPGRISRTVHPRRSTACIPTPTLGEWASVSSPSLPPKGETRKMRRWRGVRSSIWSPSSTRHSSPSER